MTENNPSLHALNHLIALYSVTAQNARFCHWNVVGPVFEDNHEIFGELYDTLSDDVDLFAERVRAIGLYPMSTLAEYLQEAGLAEYVLPMNAADMQKAMLADLEKISTKMEQFANETDHDVVTQDIIVGAKREIDKKSWMLRAMLGK